MTRLPPVSALLLATFTLAGADCNAESSACGLGLLQQGATREKSNNELLLQVDAQDLALFKLVEEIKGYNFSKFDGHAAPSLSAYISEMLLPRADETKKYLQEKVDTSRHYVEACKAMVTGAQPEAQAAQDDLSSNQAKQSACQQKDRAMMTEEELICADFAAAAMSFEKNDAVKLQKVKHNLRQFEKALKKYYDFYPLFMEQKNACFEATGEEHSQHAHCLFRMHYIDKAYCALKCNSTALCKDYKKCYKDNVKNMMEMEEKVKRLDNHTKQVYQGLSCMARNTGWEFATDVDHFIQDIVNDSHLSCDPSSIQVDHLTVWYPEVPKPLLSLESTQEECLAELEKGNLQSANAPPCPCDPPAAPAVAAAEPASNPSDGPGI